MQDFTGYLLTRRDQAAQATANARRRLIHLLERGEPQLAAATAEVCHRQAYDRWWKTVTDHIEHGGQHPMTALIDVRAKARQVLLDQAVPREQCPFAFEQAIAALEATRRFYHDTNIPTSTPSPTTGVVGDTAPMTERDGS